MSKRILDVTAYTSFDYLQGSAAGLDWKDDGIVVMNVEGDEEDGIVRISTELDPMNLERTEQHADHAELSPAQARSLASELQEAADRVETDVTDD